MSSTPERDTSATPVSNHLADERPSKTRYVVLGFLCTLAFVFYVDRICMGQAADSIKGEFGIDDSQMGYVHAAFTLAYSLFEVPTGWLGDKYGSRGVMMRIVIWWSAFTALTGRVTGLASLMTVRFLFGAGEAGAFPNTARILARWIPEQQRGMAQGLVNSMAQLGGAAAPVLTGFCMQWVGWRWTFFIFSIPGVIWAAAFYRWFRDDPATHPSVNAAELRIINAGCERVTTTAHHAIPWKSVLSNFNVYLLGAILSCTAFNTYMYFAWYPSYLKKGRAVELINAGWLTSLVLFGGAIGCIFGGIVIDALLLRFKDRRWCRRLWGCFALSSASVFVLIGMHCDSATVSAVFTACSVMMAVATLASWWGAVTDISGRHLAAMFGLMNSIGGLGAMASQLFVGYFADWQKSRGLSGRLQWDPIFYVYAGVLFVGAIGWLLIDSTRPIRGASGDETEGH